MKDENIKLKNENSQLEAMLNEAQGHRTNLDEPPRKKRREEVISDLDGEIIQRAGSTEVE